MDVEVQANVLMENARRFTLGKIRVLRRSGGQDQTYSTIRHGITQPLERNRL